MLAIKTKAKTKVKTEELPAIERLVALYPNGPEQIDAGIDEKIQLEKYSGCDYFIVHTNDFKPLVEKDSLLRVYTNMSGTSDGYAQCPRLVARNNRLEVCTHTDVKGAQVIGLVREVRRWLVGGPIIPGYRRPIPPNEME